jgi:hypothetical protein
VQDERILALDMSTKTGWASMISTPNGVVLEEYGTIPQIHEPSGQYPINYVEWAHACVNQILELIDRLAPDTLVIEETVAGSKGVYTQKILEWIHFLVAKFIKETNIKAIYLLTGSWRSEVGCKMTKEESNGDTRVAYDENGKRIGKLGKKHINVRRANEVFGKFLKTPLRKKDEDTADSLLLGYCYHLRRIKNEPVG